MIEALLVCIVEFGKNHGHFVRVGDSLSSDRMVSVYGSLRGLHRLIGVVFVWGSWVFPGVWPEKTTVWVLI